MNATFLSQKPPKFKTFAKFFWLSFLLFSGFRRGMLSDVPRERKEREKNKNSHLCFNLRLGRGTIGHGQKAVI